MLTTPAQRTKSDLNPNSRAAALVLIVDDHPDTREMFKYLVVANGCQAVEAPDGEAAVRLAESLRPDLIIMDTNLPGVDGLVATERIRGIPHLQKVKIIFISGRAEGQYRERAFAVGGDEYFLKPVDITEIQQTLKKYLSIPHTPTASESH